MGFSFTPAVRRNTHILLALAGASGSGKTYSALELATGLAGDGKIAVIDTEAGRALHYADKFKFDHCDMGPPFTPQRYREAIEDAEKAGYAVVVVDSMSHEHAGEGGLLEMAEAELLKPNMRSPANWAAPKAAHKRMMNRFLQCRSHLIFGLRAEEKIRIEKLFDERTQREKTVVVQAGWQPICEKTFMFEMVVSFVMSPEHPGIPIEGSGKIQDQHRFAFPAGKLVTGAAGKALAEWAAGGVPPAPEAPAVPEWLTQLETAGRHEALKGNKALDAWIKSLGKDHKKAVADNFGKSLRAAANTADQQASSDERTEQPADAANGGRVDAEAPQAEPQEDNFGLPLSDDEAFCANILKAVRLCTTLEAIDNVKLGWDKGGQFEAHMKRLPEPMWMILQVQIGEHEKTLGRAERAA